LGWVVGDGSFCCFVASVLGAQFHFICILGWAAVCGIAVLRLWRGAGEPMVFCFCGCRFSGDEWLGVGGLHAGAMGGIKQLAEKVP
jgi:hypothetical protein